MANRKRRGAQDYDGEGESAEYRLLRGVYIRRKTKADYQAKRQIAVFVATRYIKDFDAVLLDAGSTAEMVAEEMFARRQFLSVLTNNMGAYAAYTRARETLTDQEDSKEGPPNRGNELLVTGGRYVDTYESLLGEGAIDSIDKFNPNVIIIGTSGLRCEEGIFCHGSEEAAVKRLLWTKLTDIRLVATDWKKIGKRDAFSFGPVEQLRINADRAVVVTSQPPEHAKEGNPHQVREFDTQIQKMRKLGITVELVEVPEESEPGT